MRALEQQLGLFLRAQRAVAVAMAAGLVLFYAAEYRPTVARQQELARRIASAQRELELGRGKASGMEALVREIADLQERVQQFDRRFPRSLELAEFIRNITQISRKLALEDWAYKPAAPRRGANFMELPIQMQFKGEFLKAAAFLNELESLGRETRVSRILIESRGQQGGRVDVDLTMSIYFVEG